MAEIGLIFAVTLRIPGSPRFPARRWLFTPFHVVCTTTFLLVILTFHLFVFGISAGLEARRLLV